MTNGLRSILQIDPKMGTVIQRFKSTQEAGRVLNISPGKIAKILTRKEGTVSGFRFVYAEKGPKKKPNPHPHAIILTHIDGSVSRFKSIREAERALGFRHGGLKTDCIYQGYQVTKEVHK